jgi:hypothetical protein
MRPRLGIIWINIVLSALFTQLTFSQTDSTLIYQVKGRIVDSNTAEPVAIASIFIAGSSVGTVANMDGDFILKIPKEYRKDSVVISCMGYESLMIGLNQFNSEQNTVHLRAIPIPLEEVTIVNEDARQIIFSAIEKIRNNYSIHPLMVTTFYRESIRKGKKYVSVSEAVMEGYKASYASIFDMDRVSIKKARKSSDFKNRDTIILKLQGGPHTMFQLDFVKDPGELLDQYVMPYYEYHLSGKTIINNRLAYVISFHQLPEIEVPLYKGYFFVGVEDLAFMGAEFHLHEDHIDKAAEYMVKSEPRGAKIDVEKAAYVINYRFFQNTWYLSYVRSELIVKINWNKKLFNSTFTTKIEMAVTDMDSINVVKFKKDEIVRGKDIFIEQIADFEDPEFWGDYNVIHPDESILSSIKRMGR